VSAAAVVVSYWTDLTPAVVITVGLVAILAINLLNVRFFGEAEVITASIKILCFLGLVIVAIVITAGGAPNHEAIGFRYWRHPVCSYHPKLYGPLLIRVRARVPSPTTKASKETPAISWLSSALSSTPVSPTLELRLSSSQPLRP
jgi:amino acid permease